jgi:hypothetical protein
LTHVATGELPGSLPILPKNRGKGAGSLRERRESQQLTEVVKIRGEKALQKERI